MKNNTSRQWEWIDWVVLSIRFFWFVITIMNIYNAKLVGAKGYLLAWALMSFSLPQLFYIPQNINIKFYALTEGLLSGSFNVYLFTQIPDGINYFIIPIFIISFIAPKKWLLFLLPISFTLIPLGLWFVNNYKVHFLTSLLLNYCLFMVFGYCFRVFYEQKKQLTKMVKDIEQKNIELEHYNGQIKRITVLEERNRMARELHDIVGHSLTATIVAMEAIQVLIQKDPTKAENRLRELVVFSRANLEQFRKTVHDMGMNELKQPLRDILIKICEEFSKQTGMIIEMHMEDYKSYTADDIKLCLLRFLQEALTNAQNHGKATKADIYFTYIENTIQLTVSNNGLGTDSIQPGFGIENMRERIKVLGGSLEISSGNCKGFTIYCRVPVGGVKDRSN